MLISAIARLFIVALALLAAAAYIPGISVASPYTALIVALLLGLLNLVVYPILFVLTLPITIFTFGLFSFVLNAGLFWFVATFVEGFEVAGFIPAFFGALVVSIANWVGSKIS